MKKKDPSLGKGVKNWNYMKVSLPLLPGHKGEKNSSRVASAESEDKSSRK